MAPILVSETEYTAMQYVQELVKMPGLLNVVALLLGVYYTILERSLHLVRASPLYQNS